MRTALWLLVVLFPAVADGAFALRADKAAPRPVKERRYQVPKPILDEGRRVEALFPELPEGEIGFMEAMAILQVLPAGEERERLLAWLADEDDLLVRSSWLNADRRLKLVRVGDRMGPYHLFLFDRDRGLTDFLAFEDMAMTRLGDLVHDGDFEVIQDTPEGSSLCAHPRSWTVITITDCSELRIGLTFPYAYSFQVSRDFEYVFQNRFRRGQVDTIVVDNVFHLPSCPKILKEDSCEPWDTDWCPQRPAQTWRFRLRPDTGRFVELKGEPK